MKKLEKLMDIGLYIQIAGFFLMSIFVLMDKIVPDIAMAIIWVGTGITIGCALIISVNNTRSKRNKDTCK